MRSFRTIFALILREMATTYGRNPGGYLWAVLEPVAAIALLTIIFSVAFRSPPLGSSFALFYATGFLPFMCYSDITQKMMVSLRFSRPLLAYPRVLYTDALIARFVLNFLTHILVFAIVMTGIVMIYDLSVIIRPGFILLAFSMAAALAIGIGTLNCYLITASPSWERIWAVVNRPAFIVSGIFFTIDTVPEPYRSWLLWNPLIHMVEAMRAGFFATYDAPSVSVSYVFGVSLAFAVLGLTLLGRFHRDLLNSL